MVSSDVNLLDQQFQYRRKLSGGIFFLSQNSVLHLADLFNEYFDRGKGGQVSSVLELSFHCSISSSILDTVLYIVSFTFRSPKGLQVSSRLSHALMVSSTLWRKKSTPSSACPHRRVIWFRILFHFMVYLSVSLVIVIPANSCIPGSLCGWATFISNAWRWAGCLWSS